VEGSLHAAKPALGPHARGSTQQHTDREKSVCVDKFRLGKFINEGLRLMAIQTVAAGSSPLCSSCASNNNANQTLICECERGYHIFAAWERRRYYAIMFAQTPRARGRMRRKISLANGLVKLAWPAVMHMHIDAPHVSDDACFKSRIRVCEFGYICAYRG
jgi:hypothetical protein